MAGALTSAAKILGARKKFEESKHRRGAGGKFADMLGGKPQPRSQTGGAGKAGSAKSTVYGIAEKMQGATKKQVVDAAVAAGVHPSTASNHYFYWQKSRAEKAVAKKLGPDPVKTLEKSADPMGELKKVVGTSIGLKAPSTPAPSPKPAPAPSPKPAPEPAGTASKLKPEAKKELDKLQALRDKHQSALDSAPPGTDLHTKSTNNVKYYDSKIKSHKANPDNHVGVEKPSDAPDGVKKSTDLSKSAFVPKDSASIHESLKGSHAGAVHNLKLSESKLAQQEPGSSQAEHYKGLVDVNKAKIKDLEAKSDALKSAGFTPMAKGDVHESLQGNHGVAVSNYKHYSKQLEKPNLSAADKKHYQKNVDSSLVDIKSLEAKSEQLKAASSVVPPVIHPSLKKRYDDYVSTKAYIEGKNTSKMGPDQLAAHKNNIAVLDSEIKKTESTSKFLLESEQKKLAVHPQLQQQYTHYTGLKAALDAKDTSGMTSYQKSNHDVQKAQVEDQLKAIEKHSSAMMSKPVDKMTDTELKAAVGVLPTKPMNGQHSFDSWKDVNGIHYLDGHAGLTYMKPVRDKAGVTYNNTSSAVNSYTGSGYGAINSGLRSAKGGELPSSIKSRVNELDKLIQNSTFKEDTVMWRGVGSGGSTFNGSPPPAELTDDGFTSVSFNPGVAKGFSDGKTVFRVKVPKGFPGLNVGIGMPGKDQALQGEAEVMLPRGTTYRVVARHPGAGPSSYSGKMDVVDLEPVLPPGYPNY